MSLRNEMIFEGDTFPIVVTWTRQDGSALNLTGATVEAAAFGGAENQTIELDAGVHNSATGEAFMTLPASGLSVGRWVLQMSVTLGGIQQTFQNVLSVAHSYVEAS